MKKQYISNAEYAKAYASYKRKLQYYKGLGYSIDFSRFEKQKVKRPTKGSIRQLETLEKRLKEAVHDYRRETGYYTRRREQANIKRQITLQKKQYQKNKHQYKQNKKNKKKGKIVQLPPDKKPKMPSVSDVVLENIQAIIVEAKGLIRTRRNNKYESKIIEAGYTAEADIEKVLNYLYSKYMPDLTREEIRTEVSKRMLETNGYTYYEDAINTYLYDFVSDGQGNLDHTTVGVRALMEIIQVISGTTISTEDKKKVEEVLNSSVNGNAYKETDDIE